MILWKCFSASVLLLSTAGKVSAAKRPRSTHPPEGFRQAGEMLMRSMNSSADPCEDFYSYACGGWIAAHPITPGRPLISIPSVLTDLIEEKIRIALESSDNGSSSTAKKKARTLFKNCMDEKATSTIKEAVQGIESIGAWPMIGDEWRPSEFDLTSLLIKSHSRQARAFFNTAIKPSKNKTHFMIHIEPTIFSTTKNKLFDTTKNKEKVASYKHYLFGKVELTEERVTLIAGDAGKRVLPDALMSDIEEIFTLEQEIAKKFFDSAIQKSFNSSDDNNSTSQDSVHKISELVRMYPIVDWPRYFKSMTPVDVHEYLDSNPFIRINSESIDLKDIVDIFAETDSRIVTNYLILLYTLTFVFDTRYEEIEQKHFTVLMGYGRPKKLEPWEKCVKHVESIMPFTTKRLYNEKHFKPEFRGKLARLRWQIGDPDWILEDAYLDDHYKDFNIRPSDSKNNALYQYNRWLLDKNYKLLLLKKVDLGETTPLKVSASLRFSHHSAVAASYHVLEHAIGMLLNEFKLSAYRRYIKKHGEEPKTPMTPQLSNEQLFFLGYAHFFCINKSPPFLRYKILNHEHPPSKYRVDVVLANTPEFAEAFKCPNGSKMNPQHRCAVW